MKKLQLKGMEFTLQEWKKCGDVKKVKYSSNKDIKSSNTKIFRSVKPYSLLH